MNRRHRCSPNTIGLAKAQELGLTGRSTGAPTAGLLAREALSVYPAPRGQGSQLSSPGYLYVRPRNAHIAVTPQAEACWARFKTENPSVDDSRLYEVFCFADSKALADELGALVVTGTKRATAGSVWALDAENKSPPKPGDYSIVTAWAGQPLCVIKTLSVETVPFKDVSAEFAATEGEGDGSLEFWRAAHTAYFKRECSRLERTFSEDMPVVCERFEVASLWPAKSAA